jgi:hypothetical protein
MRSFSAHRLCFRGLLLTHFLHKLQNMLLLNFGEQGGRRRVFDIYT